MRTISLTKGFEALVDDSDFAILDQWKWRVMESKGHRYAVRQDRAKKSVLMHRFLLNPKATQQVDHRDRNGLNNQRENLRVCEDSQNYANAKLSRRNKSGFKGVCWDRVNGLWMAFIGAKPRKTIGYSHHPKEAARMYDVAAVKRYGEFALTNQQLGLIT